MLSSEAIRGDSIEHITEVNDSMNKTKDVMVLGSGIAGIMTAFAAHRAGYSVSVVSKSPDPRCGTLDSFSSTFGGEDSRYVTLTEGHPYLGTSLYVNEMYPDMQDAFTKSIFQGGWLAKSPGEFSITDRSWLEKRFQANEDQTNISDLFLAYIAQNYESMQLWEELFQTHETFQSAIDLNDQGILRVYGNETLFLVAKAFHEKHQVLLRAFPSDDLAREFSACREACEKGSIVGGLVVRGLTFRVQRLVLNIISFLESSGVKFTFNTNVSALERCSQGKVVGLRTPAGEILSAHHYSLHPGAYDFGKLFSGTAAQGKIAGVAGGWIRMPMPTGMQLPVKIHDGKHFVNGMIRPVVDLNLNPVTNNDGKKWLLIGGGYLFVGTPPFELPDEARNLMIAEIHRVTEMFLGPSYREAKRLGLIKNSARICIRSFTPNDAELNVALSTISGGVATLEGGGNTGTTTKAPWIACRAINQFLKVDGINCQAESLLFRKTFSCQANARQ